LSAIFLDFYALGNAVFGHSRIPESILLAFFALHLSLKN